MSSIISNDDCVQILRNYLRTSDGIQYISSELKPISDDVEGFMGEHNKLVITYDDKGIRKSKTFFIKSKPMNNKVQKDVAEALGMYKTEIFVYDFLLKEFEKNGYDTSFAGKSYYSIPNEVIVMEDMTLSEYSMTERGVNLTIDHLKCALESLALYHAAGYAFERTKSKELNGQFVLREEYAEYMNECFHIQYINQDMYAMNWWKGCLRTLYSLIDLLPQSEEYRQEFRDLIQKAEIGKAFALETKKINKTCGHGDLWSNNMLFKYKNNIPVKCCLIDFQICRYFYPCFDVLLAIFCNSNAKFRKLHLNELYLYYHESLAEILSKYGYNIEEIHPLEDFYKSIDLVKVEALMQNFLASVMTLLPKNTLNDVSGNESALQEIFFDNDKLAAESFKNDIKYKTTISEIIYDLRDALLERCRKRIVSIIE